MTRDTPFGLALGGGGARGYAHIGVLRVLEREGLRPGVIAGTSMGGLVGAFAAAGFNADDMQEIVSSIGIQQMLDFNPLKDWLNRDAFRKLLEKHLPARFEDLPTPLCVTATDLISGKKVYLHSGDLREALQCTIAFPGAVDPTWVGDQLLSDGGILNQVPVDAARFLGALHILAVDVTPLEDPEVSPEDRPARWWEHLLGRDRSMNWMQVMLRSLEIMQNQITETKLSLYTPDLLLRPKLGGIRPFNFNRLKDAISAGEAAAEGELARLREVFDE